MPPPWMNYWEDYDDGVIPRERVCEPGQRHVRDDHPAAVYRRVACTYFFL